MAYFVIIKLVPLARHSGLHNRNGTVFYVAKDQTQQNSNYLLNYSSSAEKLAILWSIVDLLNHPRLFC